MAEIAIPIIALGGLYILSNTDKKNKKKQGKQGKQENYTNLNKSKISSNIDSSNIEISPNYVNYPTIVNPNKSNNINYYPNPNQATDKYFDENNYKKTVDKSDITLFSGETIQKEDFQHINMVPYFGSKIRGRGADLNTSESILDNMQGQGSQNITKTEIAPLFKPENNMQFNTGSPDMTAFYQSRQVPSMKMANITPWEQIQVGPGLDKGYTTCGSDGFNAGMEARSAWLPKTVDDLRVDTNPKLTYTLNGHQGPALAPVTNVGIEGKVEKNLPDTYYASGPDRWFTTTGQEKGQTSRSEQIMQDQNRQNCTREHYGMARNSEATYVKSSHEDTKRQQLNGLQTMAAHASDQNSASPNDFGIEGYSNLPNHRATTKNTPEFSQVYGIGKAVIAPLLDILKPTRKENVIGNARINGNVDNLNGTYANNPNQLTKVTNRQITENRVGFNYSNVETQAANAYLVSDHQAVKVQRDSTNYQHLGTAGGAASRTGNPSQEAAYNQHNNINKQQNDVVNQGGTQLFNQYTNLTTIPNDCKMNPRMWVPNGGPNLISTKEQIGGLQNMACYDEQRNNDRINPDILTAFKQNPYTQSLHSAV